jgi:Uncharacterized protein conserved in bacteria C-term(DUF2220)
MNLLTTTLLHTLLDRREQPQRNRVVRVRLNVTDHASYFDVHDVAARQEVNSELSTLAKQNVVTLRWKKWQEGNWLESVDLQNAEVIYKLLRRSPRSTLNEQFLVLLDEYASSVSWVATWHDELRQRALSGRRVVPLDLEDYLLSRDVLALVKAVAELEEDTLERTLSVKLFKNSKWLESLRPALLGVLRRYAPEAELFEGDDHALLESFGLLRVPEYILLSGSLVMSGVDLSVLQSVGLPATALRSARLASKAKRVLTIENQTSFESLVAVRPTNTLLVFSGGFASPALISLLRSLSLPLYHWGDMDVGGLRILAHLRGQLGHVKPLCMDSATLQRHTGLQSLSEKERSALLTLRHAPLLEDCRTLIDTMLDEGKLEQEALGVVEVVNALNASKNLHKELG